MGTMVLTALSLAPFMRLWSADLRVPFWYSGDALLHLMAFKGVLDHGWWLENPDVGAPFGQTLYDFPVFAGEGFHFVLVRLLGVFSSDPILVSNLYFLLSFPLVALASFVVLRCLGIGNGAALVCSVLYALAPYHFLRGEIGHPFLGAYYSVPVGAYLILSVLSGKPLFARRAERGALAWASKRSLATLALCLFVAVTAGSMYYAAFTGALLIAAAAVVLVVRRDARVIAEVFVLLTAMFGFLALNAAPNLAYEFENGPNYMAATRGAEESELYGLKLAQMMLPVPEHRIDALAGVSQRYYEGKPWQEGPMQSLGLVAAVGLGWLLLVAVAGCLSARWQAFAERHRQLATATVLAILIGTIGGFSSLFAHLVTSEIRASNRLSIFIAFFALAAVAILLDAFGERIRARGGRAALVEAMLIVVLAIGLYDQSGGGIAPDYEATKNEYTDEAAFVERMDRELPPRVEVFQLPYVPFPENPPVNEMLDYDLMRPYLHESDLRWSYGAVKGRPDDWQAALADKPPEAVLPAIAAAGFDGVYIDRFGYPDRAVELEEKLGDMTGTEPLVSPNGRASFFDLSSYKERLESEYSPEEIEELRTAALRPVVASFGDGFWPADEDDESGFRWMRRTGTIVLDNPSEEARAVIFRMTLAPGTPRNSTVTASFPDGATERMETGAGGADLRGETRLAPGPNEVTIETDASPARLPDDPRDELALKVGEPEIESPTIRIPGEDSTRTPEN